MNIIGNSLFFSLRALCLRRHGDIGFEKRCRKFFSINNNSVQFMKSSGVRSVWMKNEPGIKTGRLMNDANFDEEEEDDVDSVLGGEVPQKTVDRARFGSKAEFGKRSTSWRNGIFYERVYKKSGSNLLNSYLHDMQNSFMFVAGESNILDLMSKGLKPECLFNYDGCPTDFSDESLMEIPNYDAHYGMAMCGTYHSLLGIFKQDELKELAMANEPKIPITIICDNVGDNGLIVSLWNAAIAFRCKQFITIPTDIKRLFTYGQFTGVECSLIHTDFLSTIEEAIDLTDPTSKFLVLPSYGLEDNTLLSDSMFHTMGSTDSWEKDKVVFIIRGKPLEDSNSVYENIDAKFIKFDFAREKLRNYYSYFVLCELMREYKMKYSVENDSKKPKSKKTPRKKAGPKKTEA